MCTNFLETVLIETAEYDMKLQLESSPKVQMDERECQSKNTYARRKCNKCNGCSNAIFISPNSVHVHTILLTKHVDDDDVKMDMKTDEIVTYFLSRVIDVGVQWKRDSNGCFQPHMLHGNDYTVKWNNERGQYDIFKTNTHVCWFKLNPLQMIREWHNGHNRMMRKRT